MTRSRFITLFTALAVSLAITIPVLASHADDGRSRVQPLAATMRGAAEVPPVDTDATGNIMFYIDVRAHSICFDLTTGIPAADVTGLHIHRAAPGANGPIVVFLQGADFTGPRLVSPVQRVGRAAPAERDRQEAGPVLREPPHGRQPGRRVAGPTRSPEGEVGAVRRLRQETVGESRRRRRTSHGDDSLVVNQADDHAVAVANLHRHGP